MPLEQQEEIAKFDAYARTYEQAHGESVRASGEPPEYFARHKLGCLRRCGVRPEHRVLDYGCGTGQLTRWLVREHREVFGYDPSAESLTRARRAAPGAQFAQRPEAIPEAAFDAVVLAGVLHHVPPELRDGVLANAAEKLRGGGSLFVFEHNPFNPLTRRAVRDCPFDDDAILLRPREVRSRLSSAGLTRVRQGFVLFFPRALRALRPLEPWLAPLPLGAQTLTHGVRQWHHRPTKEERPRPEALRR